MLQNMNENTMMITIFISLGVLEIILGLPLMYKKIKPNNFYGFRMKKTLSNEKLWYETNKFMGRDLYCPA